MNKFSCNKSNKILKILGFKIVNYWIRLLKKDKDLISNLHK